MFHGTIAQGDLMEDDKLELITKSTLLEKVADAFSVLSNIVGEPVTRILAGNILSICSSELKFKRVKEAVDNLAEEFQKLKSQASKEYVKTDDCKELLGYTLSRIAEERSERKRKAFQAILLNSVKEGVGKYDEKIRFLRCLEDLEEDQLQVLKVFNAHPDGIEFPSLDFQLKVMPRERIRDLLFHLSGLGIVDTVRSDGIIALSQFGQRFVQFIMSD